MVTEVLDFYGTGAATSAPISNGLRMALRETARREPLLAAEDAIMLVDIIIALSRNALSVDTVLSNPLVHGWLSRAITDNHGRPIADALREARFLRDVLVVRVFRCYRDGQLRISKTSPSIRV
jgi:hypothetical protein